mgnify:CR=1 FL=1
MNKCLKCGHQTHEWIRVQYGALLAMLGAEKGRCSEFLCVMAVEETIKKRQNDK